MSAVTASITRWTVWPLMSMPRMSRARACASSGPSASFTPPALPRPPVFTWALTTTRPPSSSAPLRASSGALATAPGSTGTPCLAKTSFAWYSNRSTVCPFLVCDVGCRREVGRQGRAAAVRGCALPARLALLRASRGAPLGVIPHMPFTWTPDGGGSPPGRRRDVGGDPVDDRLGGRAGGEDLRDAEPLQLDDVGLRHDAAAEHHDVLGAPFPQQFQDAGEEGHVCAGEHRESDAVGVLLDRGLHDLLRGL